MLLVIKFCVFLIYILTQDEKDRTNKKLPAIQRLSLSL